jgi:retinol-binding protein 3
MIRRLVLLLLFSTGFALAQPAIPDTPAGHVLQAWLDAFNSADRAKIENYIKTYDPNETVDGMISFHGQTGGFDLVSIDSNDPLRIRFQVKERASTTLGLGNLSLKSAEPHQVDQLNLRAIPPGAAIENITLDAAERQRVIDGIGENLKKYYVYPEGAQKMTDAVVAHLKSGAYGQITDGDEFASKLTHDLRDVSHDGHLHVVYSPYKTPPEHDGGPSPDEEARFRKDMERENCGFKKVEILPGNIGYVKFDFFANPDICGPTVVAAMGFLAHVDAIIYDLRENGGGDPRMVSLVCTWLFDHPVHLNDIYDRAKDETTQYWTLSYVAGQRLDKIPAFVLTAKRTFSGGEEFTYDLQTQKRATIVGETTGGGAHPVSGHRIDDHFGIGVPFGRPVNPITKKDWEGTGVVPDVAVKADDALDTAQKLAATKIQESKKDVAENSAR